MSTAQVQRTVDFGRGLYSGTSRFSEPQGSVPRVSNLIWLRRGALRTTDGTLLLSSLNGQGPATGQNPFRWIGRYAPSAGITTALYALQIGAGVVNLIDVTGGAYGAPLVTYATFYPTPSFVQTQDALAIALGMDVVPQIFSNGVSTPITNSWFGVGKLPLWTAQTAYAGGTAVIPAIANGHVYIALNNGNSGKNAPAFPTAANATVTDNQVVWQEAGSDSPPVPMGAAFVFFHGGYLFLWGTSAAYQADNLNGPDALMQSDLLNVNSWNSLNATFVGKGDGTIARGGGVLTLSEVGIAATSQLVLFKDVDTYVFNGFFPNWTLNKTPSGVGCIAPGTVQFLAGVGLFRLSYRGVALFNGQDDQVDQYTDPIRAYLFGDDEAGITRVDWQNAYLAMAAQCDNPKMYLLAVPLVGGGSTLTRIFAYDVVLEAWSIIDLPFGIASLAYIPENDLIFRTLFGGASDGTIQAFANNASPTWNGIPVSWSVRTPEIGAPDTPSYIRRLNVRGQGVLGGAAALTGGRLNYQGRDGIVRTKTLIPPAAAKVVSASLDVDVTCLSANVDLSGTGRAILEGIGYQFTPKPPSRIGGGSAQQQSLQQVVTVVYQAGGNVVVAANAQTATVVLATFAPNANYLVTIAPSWNTTWWVASKTIAQFVVFFNTPAPPDGTGSIDWTAQILQ